ncbi:hypothetical protein VTH06DRAFT_5867 [Thermothelomyces fergusii]
MVLLAQGRDVVSGTVVALAATLLLVGLRRVYWHRLSHLPGPLVGRATNLFLYAICYLGVEGRVLRHYHRKYRTRVLRVGPNAVSVSDSAAVRDIYVADGGFAKDARYEDFDLGPVRTIFSSTDTAYRDERAKAVAALFAPGRLRAAATEPGGAIAECVADFVRLVRDLKAEQQQQHHAGERIAAAAGAAALAVVDLLDACARLCIDATTAYLVGARYGGLREHAGLPAEARREAKLSANPFIFAVVRFARFSLLPGWLFRAAYGVSSWLSASDEVAASFARLDRFAAEAVRRSVERAEAGAGSGAGAGADDDDTYQRRLLDAGISPAETEAQVKAIVFAGADSVAVMLATILFHLVRDGRVRRRLRAEIRAARAGTSGGAGAGATDPQSLPYLRAVVREGLRLGMANPARLTRVVPARGLRVGGTYVPGGTVVGCAAYVLHHDEDTFPDPFAFRPERWLDGGDDDDDDDDEGPRLRRPDMARSWIPYGAGLRACLGKNLAQQILHAAVAAVVESDVLEGARTRQDRIEIVEWFNAEIKGHKLEIEWPC